MKGYRAFLSRGEWVYFLSVLAPLVAYNLTLKTVRILSHVEDPGFFEFFRLISSDIAFSLAYVTLWVGLFALTKKRSASRRILVVLLPAVLFITLNREDFSFVIHLDRQPRTSRRREAQTGSRARSGSRSERTLDAVEHSRTLMEWWPFLIFHRGGLRIKVINNKRSPPSSLSSRASRTNISKLLAQP